LRGVAEVNSTPEHAGEPHRGTVSEAEAEIVRDDLDAANERLRACSVKARVIGEALYALVHALDLSLMALFAGCASKAKEATQKNSPLAASRPRGVAGLAPLGPTLPLTGYALRTSWRRPLNWGRGSKQPGP
jgi:hypothetical protein